MTSLTIEEIEIIQDFAAGDEDLRERAIEIYEEKGSSSSKEIELQFMREVVSKAPDLSLKRIYRSHLVEAVGNRTSFMAP